MSIIINRLFFSPRTISYDTRLNRILIIPTSRLLFFIALPSTHLHRTYTITYLLPQALSLLDIESSIQCFRMTWLIKIFFFFFSFLVSIRDFLTGDRISPSDKILAQRIEERGRSSMQPRIIIDPVSRLGKIFFRSKRFKIGGFFSLSLFFLQALRAIKNPM